MRQILASFFCFGENFVKSNEVKTKFDKRSFFERKIRQFVTLQKTVIKIKNTAGGGNLRGRVENEDPMSGAKVEESRVKTGRARFNLHRG